MFEFLDKLRQKPKPVRQQIALVTTTALSLIIFSVWWTTFTATESESAISVSEALSPVGALTEMAAVGVDSFDGFTDGLKSHVLQVQYEATSSDSSALLGGVGEGDGASHHGSADVVYPEDVYGTDGSATEGAASNE